MFSLWRHFRIAELTKVMRQKGDNSLIDLLNKIRIAGLDDDAKTLLKSRFISDSDDDYPKNAVHIWAENKPVSDHNNCMLEKLDTPSVKIDSIDTIPKNVPTSLIEKARNRGQMETGGLARTLTLKVGAKVMLTANIDIESKLTNGQIGTVYHIKMDSVVNDLKVIYVKFEDDSIGIKQKNADIYGKHKNVVPITKSETNIFLKRSASSVTIKRTQFPLMLAWACTVHKVQGKQFPEVVVSFNLLKQRSFNYGQMYVALSRVTAMKGLHLIGEYKSSAIRADPKAILEYETLRNNYIMTPINRLCKDESSLTVMLLNVRSLKKTCH